MQPMLKGKPCTAAQHGPYTEANDVRLPDMQLHWWAIYLQVLPIVHLEGRATHAHQT